MGKNSERLLDTEGQICNWSQKNLHTGEGYLIIKTILDHIEEQKIGWQKRGDKKALSRGLIEWMDEGQG